MGIRLPGECSYHDAHSSGDEEASLGEFAWYVRNSDGKTHPVGEKRPNGFDLFDMHGNVWEWCWDGYGEDYYKQSREDDPRGLDGGSARVIRGGGWRPAHVRLVYRLGLRPDTGHLRGLPPGPSSVWSMTSDGAEGHAIQI